MNNLPTYFMTFDPEDFESGINLIAITETPAIEKNSLRFSEQEILKMIFKDDDKQMVAGPAIIPDKPIYRNMNGKEFYVVFTKEVIEQMVAKFNSETREYKFNIEHEEDSLVAGYIKGSWIIEDTEFDKSKFYGFNDLPIGTWFIEAQVEDKEIWTDHIKQMKTVGFSIEGLLGMVTKENLNEQNKKFMKDNKEKVELAKIEADKIKLAEELKVKEDAEAVIKLAEEEAKVKAEEEAKAIEDAKAAEGAETDDEPKEDEITMQDLLEKIIEIQTVVGELEAKMNSKETEEVKEVFTSKEFSFSDRIESLRNKI